MGRAQKLSQLPNSVSTDSSGNVGIGTDTPTAKLDIVGTAKISGAVTLSAATANGVPYMNGSKEITSGGALTFDGSKLTATGSMATPMIVTDSSLGFRNRIINGDMRIDQRNAGASVTPLDGQYLVDRWAAYRSQASKFSAQQNAGAVTPPPGFANYLGMTSLSAYASLAADYFGINQHIEGFNVADLAWGTADAKAVTLSFWARSSLTGVHGGAIRNNGDTRVYLFSYTVSSADTWEFKTITIPGDTTGTWLSGANISVMVWFDLGSGSNSTGAAGAWGSTALVRPTGSVSMVGTNGATFYVTGIQIEAGSVATPFERRDYGQKLIMCQRYFERGLVPVTYLPINTGDYFLALMTPINFKVTRRNTSYVMTYAGLQVYASGSPVNYTGSTTTVNVGIDQCSVYLSTAVTNNNGVAAGTWTCSNEL